MIKKLPILCLSFVSLGLSACGDEYEWVRVESFPYNNARTAGSAMAYVKKSMLPQKSVKVEPADFYVDIAPAPVVEDIYKDVSDDDVPLAVAPAPVEDVQVEETVAIEEPAVQELVAEGVVVEAPTATQPVLNIPSQEDFDKLFKEKQKK